MRVVEVRRMGDRVRCNRCGAELDETVRERQIAAMKEVTDDVTPV